MAFVRLAVVAFCLGAWCSASSQVKITEIMQSNVDCIMDDINEFPDSWVEIYNSGTAAVTLSNYSIGLTDNADEAWTLPSERLGPGAYKLIYCDKEASGFHTNFRLDSGKGGGVYLFENKTVTDKLENIAKQPAPNISYGRLNANSAAWGYQYKPTPGSANCGKLCTLFLDGPVFNTQGQVFNKSGNYTIDISLPEGAPADAVIRYTMTGQEPTESSPAYQNPIQCSTTRVIRAKVFCDGYLSSPSVTQSYIIHPRNVDLPVVSIVTDNSYFYDNKKGIYVDGTYSSSAKNYQYNWRRPVNVEYFVGTGEESKINQLCELRCAGAASRGAVLKSLALYANKRFGKKHFKYEFFPEERPGLEDYKSIMIRNAGNDFDYLYMRDAMIQRSVARHVDLDYQAWQPALFYFNGKYMGILNVRERGNENNIYTNYDHFEDIDMFENWGDLKLGTWDNLNAFKTFYSEHGHTMEEYGKWLDIDEYINYMAMNIFYNNLDFPANNVMMWRPRTDDGRWRFIAKDLDYTIGIYGDAYNYAYMSWFYNNSYDSNRSWGNTYDATRLFRRLMEDDSFKSLFLERMAIYMGSFLSYDHIWKETWEPMYNEIKTEYPYHREPINKWWPNYADELKNAQTWTQSRTAFLYNHIATYYEMGTMAQVVVNNQLSDEEKQSVSFSFNGIDLCDGEFDGKYYPGHTITLKGTTIDDKAVTGWSVIRVGNDGKAYSENIDGDTYSVTMPSCTRLQANAILGDADKAGIETVEDGDGMSEIAEIYDVNGIRRERLQPGINIIKLKNGKVRKIEN